MLPKKSLIREANFFQSQVETPNQRSLFSIIDKERKLSQAYDQARQELAPAVDTRIPVSQWDRIEVPPEKKAVVRAAVEISAIGNRGYDAELVVYKAPRHQPMGHRHPDDE